MKGVLVAWENHPELLEKNKVSRVSGDSSLSHLARTDSLPFFLCIQILIRPSMLKFTSPEKDLQVMKVSSIFSLRDLTLLFVILTRLLLEQVSTFSFAYRTSSLPLLALLIYL